MRKEAKLASLLIVFVSLASVVSAQSAAEDYKDSLRAQCDVASDGAFVDITGSPYNATLFGEQVEKVECGNLDAYNFSGGEQRNAVSDGGLTPVTFVIGLIPLLVTLGSSGYLSYGYQIELDEGLVLIASAVTSFILGGVLALGVGSLSFIPWPVQAIPVLAGFAAPAVLIFLNENIEEDDVKLRMLITGITSTGLLITTLMLLIFSSGSL
ncbi:hypothetical protein [Candidatus Nanohalovita haloferacivicina]|uniref:hypothetical protein n=1 Tax=Candidatus Nanohalovita haloferacivicina TaxID=2978046 RepID=UPI00325FDDBE|nr:hypothetical protein HBNXNv_0664 [Candidatus Nanohalobia archaeon BNXNv]